MYTCLHCKSNLLLDEIIGLNCNNEIVPTDTYSIENNAQNPDYLVSVLCEDCYDKLFGK